MPAKIVVVSPSPISVDDFATECEVDAHAVTNIDTATDELPSDATGLFIRGNGDSSHSPAIATIVRDALATDIPILATGPGMHLLNLALSGDGARPTSDHVGDAEGDVVRKSMFLAPGAKVSSTIGGSGWLTIPCSHAKGIFQSGLAPELMASAISSDRVVEAFEMPGRRWLIGVQWPVTGAIKMPRGFDSVLMAFVERATGK